MVQLEEVVAGLPFQLVLLVEPVVVQPAPEAVVELEPVVQLAPEAVVEHEPVVVQLVPEAVVGPEAFVAVDWPTWSP